MTTLLEAARAGRQELRILLCHDTPKCMKCVPLHAAIAKLDAAIAVAEKCEPVAWLYMLEYGTTTANRKVSIHQLRYPFGVCGSDYSHSNVDGISYIRETPLYALQGDGK